MNKTQNKNIKDQKIAIIGAGISGLTAAHILKKLGYNNITIFEANEYVGGRIHTVKFGGNYYEAGSVFSLDTLKETNELARQFNQPLERLNMKLLYLSQGEILASMKYMRQKFSLMEISRAMLRFYRQKVKHKYFKNILYTNADPELFINFNEYTKKHKLEPIAYASEPSVVQYGYGRFDKLPTVYLMKNLVYNFRSMGIKEQLNSNLPFNFAPYLMFKNGFQALPVAMAKGLNIRLNTSVTRITRTQENGSYKIRITADDKTEVFDRLVITAAPNHISRFLDMNEEEEKIFSRVKFYHFHSILFYGDSLPTEAVVPVECVEKADDGYPCTIFNIYPEKKIFQSWQLLSEDIPQDKLNNMLQTSIKDIGGKVDKILFRQDHIYFPHFSARDLQELDPYNQLEALQGQNGTYFLGSLFNGETTNYCIEYAQYLVDKHF